MLSLVNIIHSSFPRSLKIVRVLGGSALAVVACNFQIQVETTQITSFATAEAQVDVFEKKLTEYIKKNYVPIEIIDTPDVKVVYLCKSDIQGWWAYKLKIPDIKRASLNLQGASPYNTYETGGQGHGQGVFFGYERGPLTEFPVRVENQQFDPLPSASLSVTATTKDGTSIKLDLGGLSQKNIRDLTRCLGHSFPRALHRQVLIGRNRPKN